MGLHWLMLLLLVAVFAAMELSDGFPKGSDTRASLKTLHFTLGLTLFTLVWVRLIAKLVSPAPLIHPPIARWQEVTAKVVQALLYLLMIAMPLLGWAGLGWLILSAPGKSIPFYGWQLPALITENKGLVETIKEIHEIGASAIYVLVGIHAAAALYHHCFVRDNTLLHILPERA